MNDLIQILQDNIYVVLAGFVILVAGLLYLKISTSRKRTDQERKSQAYVSGLNEFIAGNYKNAKDLFTEAVRFDTDNIDAYLKLGMLYRLEDNPGKALKIHKELTVRGTLSTAVRINIYRNIIEDYINLGNLNEALTNTEKLLSIDPKNKWAAQIYPKIYALKKDWKNAFKYLKAGAEPTPEVNRQLALYKIANGIQLMEINEFHDARLLFKEAIKLDRSYPPPYLLLGKAYSQENRTDDAVKVWREFADEVPQKSYLVYDYLDKAYFETGNYAAMEVFYTKIIERDSDNYKALINLGEIYFKKGDKDKAFEMTERSLKIKPDAPEGLKNLILYMNNSGDLQVIKEKAMTLAEAVSIPKNFICKNCGTSVNEILIQCPECEQWDTFEY